MKQCELYNYKLCKNDVCVTDPYNNPKHPVFIELPDINGTFHRYIYYPFDTYDPVSDYDLNKDNNVNDDYVSTKCETNSQCFSDYCNNNECSYISTTTIEVCRIIHKNPRLFTPEKSRYHCGRTFNASCNKNDECAFDLCSNGRCVINTEEYTEDYSFHLTLQKRIFALIIMIIIIAILIICCCRLKNKMKIHYTKT
ncbi:hypothetical protein LY90DRAFT_516627 [Neocallimastix californiae]|uniref:Uncharacterized protein n=1 Tax=Neocallimastix californiae TaxID=1754190 RepID=A0A1Y2ADM5_9FUNG|nr:hypothetical protein LY90DRAFT_516627 [Neocallimastix californiae]|eukprot:ORY20606.1 hypothetical protein LY90DRAFT_516627 [Neocallimastix californiae]